VLRFVVAAMRRISIKEFMPSPISPFSAFPMKQGRVMVLKSVGVIFTPTVTRPPREHRSTGSACQHLNDREHREYNNMDGLVARNDFIQHERERVASTRATSALKTI